MGSLHKHQELCYINSMEKREASSHLTSQETPNLMEPEVSLSCSQEPFTVPYP